MAEINNLTHHGFGDVVGGDKKVYTNSLIDKLEVQVSATVSVQVIKSNLVRALQDFRDNKQTSAKATLNAAASLDGLDNEARLAIASVSVLLSDEPHSNDCETVKTYANNGECSHLCSDLAHAASLKLLHIEKGAEIARRYYEKSCGGYEYAQYLYIQRLATQDEITGLLLNESFSGEFVMLGLFHRALEFGLKEGAGGIMARLEEQIPFSDFKREKLLLNCVTAPYLKTKDYFCLTSSEKASFDKLKDELIRVNDASEQPDVKLVNMAMQFFEFTQFTSSSLKDLLQRHIDTLQSRDFFGNEPLERLLTGNIRSDFDHLSSRTSEELVTCLVDESPDNFCNFPACSALFNSGDTASIGEALRRLSEASTLTAKAQFVALAAISIPIMPRELVPWSKLLETIMNGFTGENVSVSFLDVVAPTFTQIGHPELAVCLYRTAFDGHRPWLSDIYYSYMRALLQAQQVATLTTLLADLSDEEKQRESVITLQSMLAVNSQDHALAASMLRENIDNYDRTKPLTSGETKNLVYLWGQYLSAVQSYDPEQARDLTRDVPTELLSECFGDISWHLASHFAHRISDVGEFMIDWFFHDRYSNAEPFFSVFMHSTQYFPDQSLSRDAGKYRAAYEYVEGHSSHIKLVVPQSHKGICPPSLLAENSSAAKTLQGASVGDAILLSVKMYTLKEILPPLVAVYRLAIEIMDDDEEQVFHRLAIPKDATGEEIMEVLEQLGARMQEQRAHLKPIMKQHTPVDMKYRHLNGVDNNHRALSAFLSSGVHFNVSISEDTNVHTDCADFVLDEVGAIGLACIGPHLFDDCKWHMQEPVYRSLRAFCSGYDGKSPFYNEKGDFINFLDEKEEDAIPSDVIANLQTVLDKTVVHEAIALDYPLKLKVMLGQLVTDSFMASYSLGLHLGVGMFCLDAYTRASLPKLLGEAIPLAPNHFNQRLLECDDVHTINNLLWLNRHHCFTLTSLKNIQRLVAEADDSELNQLLKLAEGKALRSCKDDFLILIIYSCIIKLVFSMLNEYETTNVHAVLVRFLTLLMASSTVMASEKSVFVALLPENVIFLNEFSAMVGEAAIFLRAVFEKATDLYTEALTASVQANGYSVDEFWNAFSEACV